MFDDLLDLDLERVLQVLVSLVGAGMVDRMHGDAQVVDGFVVGENGTMGQLVCCIIGVVLP